MMNHTRKNKTQLIRELEIETSLERVRSQILGMQESSEIGKVSDVLFAEFRGLGYDLSQSGIVLMDVEKNTSRFWLSSELFDTNLRARDGKVFPLVPDEMRGSIYWKEWKATVESWQRGDKWHVTDLSGEALKDFFRAHRELRGASKSDALKMAKKRAKEVVRRVRHRVFNKYGCLDISTSELLGDDDLENAHRFSQLFEFAYSRYLEIKQKEDQNRELTVQNALERVRARALGMQVSEEISGVATTLLDEFTTLGYDVLNVRIYVHDKTHDVLTMYQTSAFARDVMAWSESDLMSRKGWETPMSQIFDWERKVLAAKASGVPYHIRTIPHKESWQDTLEWQAENLGKGQDWVDQKMKIVLERAPDETCEAHAVFFDYGYLEIHHPEKLSEGDLQLASRFGEAFGFAYERFKELQEKEAQNRELTIQNALERIRARALGMQESKELGEVVWDLFEEATKLGMDPCETRMLILKPGEERGDHWMATRYFDRSRGSNYYRTRKVSEDVWFQPVMDAWRGGDRWYLDEREITQKEYDREEKAENLSRLKDRGVSLAEIEQMLKDRTLPGQMYYMHFIFFSYGVMAFHTDARRYNEDELDVLARFTGAFEFAYKRFIELQTKESQTREARRRAAVDRVRAEATAMQQSADVVQVLAGLWQGLQDAGLSFNTCGIQFVNEPANALTLYTIAETVDGMPEQKLFRKNVFDGVDIYATNIPLAFALEQGYATPGIEPSILTMTDTFPQDMASYWDTDSADIFARFAGVDMLNIPIANGGTVIFAPADHRYTDQDLQIGKDFADAISLGFTRYFDFQRLEEQNRKLEVANAEVREATRLKSQFLATMSHELRTPMNAIIGFTRLVLRRGKNLEDRQRENLEKVQLSADHLLSLINDILDLSKVEAGRVDIMASSFYVAPVIENCCATVGPTMGKPGVDLVPDIQGDMGQVHTDEARLRQVIINLVSNALKFTESGEVRVAARLVKRDLEIVVSDTGIGIPEDQLETIFEEFRQVDNSSTRQHQGTGLGLAITKKLIELLGGTISVQSEEGKGSTFTLYIPSTYGEALQFREVPVISSQTRLIVSIDDDPNVAVLLRQELEEDGYQVISALNADEGIALVKQHKPLAVTTDILMPGKDGWQTIAALKEDEETRDIPIIVVSAIENRSLGFSMGVHDYLVKPFDRDGLIATLSRIKIE